MSLYRETFVWRRLSTRSAVRYVCLEDIEDALFCVQSADYFYLPYDDKMVRGHAKQFLELLIQGVPRGGWFTSLPGAIRAFDDGFGDLVRVDLPIELPEAIAFAGARVTAIENRPNAIVLTLERVTLIDLDGDREPREADARLRLGGGTSIVIDGEPAPELPMAGDHGELRAIATHGGLLTMSIAWTVRPPSAVALRHYAVTCDSVGMIEPPVW